MIKLTKQEQCGCETKTTLHLDQCPFCGGKVGFRIVHTIEDMNNIGWCYKITCKNCSATMPGIGSYETLIKMSEDGELSVVRDERNKATERWNRREGSLCNG